AKCCEQAEIGRPQPLARAESTRTQGYVLAGATGVSTALDTGPDGDAVTLALAILLHDHHVGAFRQHRASEDARRHALRQASRRIVTGGNTVDTAQGRQLIRVQVVETHRVAVDGGVVVARHGDGCRDLLGKRAAECLPQWYPFDAGDWRHAL